jgi:hypothetical protein
MVVNFYTHPDRNRGQDMQISSQVFSILEKYIDNILTPEMKAYFPKLA